MLTNKNNTTPLEGGVVCLKRLGASYIGRGWPLFTLSDFKGDDIAFLEFLKCYSRELLGVEEEILLLAFDGDKAEAFAFDELFDSACWHSKNFNDKLYALRNSTPFAKALQLDWSITRNQIFR